MQYIRLLNCVSIRDRVIVKQVISEVDTWRMDSQFWQNWFVVVERIR